MRRRRESGSVLMMVFTLMMLLITIVVALCQVTSLTWAETMRTETELEARQLARLELLKQLKGVDLPRPTRMGLAVNVQADASQLYANAAAPLFNRAANLWSGFANLHQGRTLSYDSKTQGYAGHRYLRFDLRGGAVPSGGISAVSSQQLPYAVVTASAARDAVQIERLVSWRNPLYFTSQNPPEEFSSASPSVLTSGGVDITQMPAGRIFTARGARVHTNVPLQGAGPVAYALDNPPETGTPVMTMAALTSTLRTQIVDARTRLQRAAQSADKTDLLTGQISRTDTLGIFFSQITAPTLLRQRLTLRESQNFWLPTIPGFTRQFFVFYHFIFHVPATPDGSLSGVAKKAADTLDQLMEAVRAFQKALEALEDAKSEVDSWQATVNAMHCGSLDFFCEAGKLAAEGILEVCKAALSIAQAAVSLAENALMVIISPVTAALEAAIVSGGPITPPHTRAEEANYSAGGIKLDEKGCDYWSYSTVLTKMMFVISDFLHWDWSRIGEDMGGYVPLVFFGQKDKQQKFVYTETFVSSATWNVPRGRTFHFNGNMSIYGDLWIGRGATMVVNGNLTMNPGDATATGESNRPQGQIFLEEGANLLVGQTLRGAGTREAGSVVVSSPVGASHAISSSILCGRDALLPFGVFPGVVVDELPGSGGIHSASRDLFAPLLDGAGANLAKLVGPVHTRFPLVARYATTFEVIALPVGPIPYVCPMDFPNFMVPVVRGLIYLYAPTLNFTVGENFMTHCDWWGSQGEGRVPIFSKPHALELARSLDEGLKLNLTVDPASKLAQRKEQISGHEVDRFCNGMCLGLMAEWTKSILTATGIPLVSVGTVLSKILTYIENEVYSLKDRKDAIENILPKAVWDELWDRMEYFWIKVAISKPGPLDLKTLLQECPGVLVYAGGDLHLGDGANPALLSCGWFVAEHDLWIYSDVTVGSLMSLAGGRIMARQLLFYPPFTRASLFVPQEESNNWRDRGANSAFSYNLADSRSEADKSADIGVYPESLSSQTWGGAR